MYVHSTCAVGAAYILVTNMLHNVQIKFNRQKSYTAFKLIVNGSDNTVACSQYVPHVSSLISLRHLTASKHSGALAENGESCNCHLWTCVPPPFYMADWACLQ